MYHRVFMSGNGNYPKEGFSDSDRNNISEYKVFVDEFGIPVEVEDPGLLVRPFVREFKNVDSNNISECNAFTDESDDSVEVEGRGLRVDAQKFKNKKWEFKNVDSNNISECNTFTNESDDSVEVEGTGLRVDAQKFKNVDSNNISECNTFADESDDLVKAEGTGLRVDAQKFKNEKLLGPTTMEKACKDGEEKSVTEPNWDIMFGLLQQFKNSGNKIPTELGAWLQTQRELMEKGKLRDDKQQKLEDIGVVLDCSEEQLNKMFGLSRRYVTRSSRKRKRNSNVPSEYVEEGVNLGQRLGTQQESKKKRNLRNGGRHEVKEDKMEKSFLERKWDEGFALMKRYKKREGHLNIPTLHIEEGKTLGRWVERQRVLMKKGKIRDERRQKLEAVGVIWDGLEDHWNEMFELLKAYGKREGNPNASADYVENGVNLGHWLNTNRKLMNKGKMREDRRQKLEAIGVVQDYLQEKWNVMFALFRKYIKREQDINVPYSHVEGDRQLGHWLEAQRSLMKRGKLPDNRRKILVELGVKPNCYDEKWNEWFELLRGYIKREGHITVPFHHIEQGKNLGQWFSRQLGLLKHNRMSNGRRRKLKDIGVV